MQSATPEKKIRVLIVDDHETTRRGLVELCKEKGMDVVAVASTGEKAITAYQLHEPQVTLMDLTLPDMDGEAAIKVIRTNNQGARIIAISAEGGERIKAALEAGALGYHLKEDLDSHLVEAIRRISLTGKEWISCAALRELLEVYRRGEYRGKEKQMLTAKDIEVAKLLYLKDKQIAKELDMKLYTVKSHIKTIYEKLGKKQEENRSHAIMLLERIGITQVNKPNSAQLDPLMHTRSTPSDPIENGSESQIGVGVNVDLTGRWEYRCSIRHQEHEWGGKATIRQEHNSQFGVQWSLDGQRLWERRGKDNVLMDPEIRWFSDWGTITQDETIRFGYRIGLQPDQNVDGYGWGRITSGEGSDTQPAAFDGTFYQLQSTIFGTMKFRRMINDDDTKWFPAKSVSADSGHKNEPHQKSTKRK